jgi:uracil-DNA glycosylase
VNKAQVIKITERQQTIFDLVNAGEGEQRAQEQPEPAPEARLEQLKVNCLACQRCVLRKGCTQVVFGDGNPKARLMLVGEGPGADEDRLGIPFVGKAGQLLDRILEAASIKRHDIYIANVVKCRPPGNRQPQPQEVDSCLPYLREQIELINPEILVCLGALALRTLLDKKATITSSRGKWHQVDGRRMIATFHPAALLRDPGKKKDVWTDFKEIIKYYHTA